MNQPAHQGYSTRGGAYGISARLDDLEITADQLDRIARELAGASTRALVAQGEPVLTVTSAVSPPTWAEVKRTTSEFTLFVGAALIRLEGTALALRSAVAGYRMAEQAVEHIVDDALTALGNLAGHAVRMVAIVLAPAAVVALAAVVSVDIHITVVSRLIRRDVNLPLTRALVRGGARTAQRAADELTDAAFTHPGTSRIFVESLIPGFVAGLVGVPPHVQTGTRVLHSPQQVADRTVKAGYYTGVLSTDVTITKESQTTARQAHATDLSELYARERSVTKGRQNGHVRVDTVVGTDGVERVVVYVPATTNWTVGSGNGTDMQSNLETMAGEDSAMRQVVRHALTDAGVDSSTEVMMVGYSQGGIVAMSLASDSAFTAQHNVTTVVTVGSPVSDYRVDESVEVLSIEHSEDLVPQLDGSINPDEPNWTTVVTDPQLDPHQGAHDAHSGDVYADAIERIEDDPAVRDFKEKRSEFFSGSVTESHEYSGSRN